MTAKLCIAVLLAGTAIAQAARAEELTVATGGGLIADAERAAFFVPTAKALGVTFKEETIQNLRDIRVQVQSNAVTWDLAQLGLDECQLAAKEGLLEKIDRSIVSTDGIEAAADMDYCIPAYYYSTVLAWNTATGQPMNSWADFFDAEKFPGARSVYKYPRGNLEMALLADGVAPDKLYPLDLDRAFEKLAQLKPEIQASVGFRRAVGPALEGRGGRLHPDLERARVERDPRRRQGWLHLRPRHHDRRHLRDPEGCPAQGDRHESARDVPRRSSRRTSR